MYLSTICRITTILYQYINDGNKYKRNEIPFVKLDKYVSEIEKWHNNNMISLENNFKKNYNELRKKRHLLVLELIKQIINTDEIKNDFVFTLLNNEYSEEYILELLHTEFTGENRIKKVDRQLVLHRQSFLKVNGYAGVAKILTHDARYTWKIPFSEVSATKLSIMYRNDRTVFASVSDQSLPAPNVYDNYGGAKVEYIFDNTRKRGLNLYNGTRFKMWAEYWRLVKEEQHDLFTMGFDFRNYKKIHRDLIWANRIAGATSLGKDRLVYYLGGVDNWLNPQFDNSINIVKPEQYQFQTLATNLRGFKQNIRNGNNFVVWNSELRWPIFKYLLNRPIRSDFVQNFQIIGFGDLGMAWYDVNPYSDENVLNKNVYVGNPVTLTIFNQKEPIVGGYGLGLRSRLLGYFIRVDFAWGVDDKKVQKGMTYLSLTTDF
jgi:hypothetical protein